MHPHYSQDLGSNDYHVFLSIANNFTNVNIAVIEAYKNRLSQYFANRDKGFYDRSIMKLPSKWQQAIKRNGANLTEIGSLNQSLNLI